MGLGISKPACLLILVMSFMACNEIRNNNTPVEQCKYTLVASIGDNTKTYLSPSDNKTMALLWSEGDAIDVSMNGGPLSSFSMVDKPGEGAGYNKATFEGNTAFGNLDFSIALYPSGLLPENYFPAVSSVGREDGYCYWTTIPDEAWAQFDSLGYKVSHISNEILQIPLALEADEVSQKVDFANQKYTPLPDARMNIMAALVKNEEISFDNLSGYFQFQLKGTSKVGRLELIVSEFDYVSILLPFLFYSDTGDFICMSGLAKDRRIAGGINKIILDCEGGIQLSSDATSFYIAVINPVIEKGISLRVFDTEGRLLCTKHKNGAIKLHPGEIQPMGVFEVPSESEVKGPNAVDLGLPSGTLWADCNLGAENPAEYGKYYAWGETIDKNTYVLNNYLWWTSSQNMFKKYYPSDSRVCLDDYDDAAASILGKNWHTPTYAQWEELRDCCDWNWSTVQNINGYYVSSRNNDNKIFIPAAGWLSDGPVNVGRYGHYMSASISFNNSPEEFLSQLFFNDARRSQFGGQRHLGYPVRPVYYNRVVPDEVSVYPGSLTLESGNSADVWASVYPTTASELQVFWFSSDTTVATVNQNGLVTAVKKGSAIITAASTIGNIAGRCSVSVVGKVDNGTIEDLIYEEWPR